MAVLVEGISVIVRRAAILARYPGGWDGYVSDCPNQTLCADQHLTRVGFMAPDDSRAFVNRLSGLGFAMPAGGESGDVAVVDQVAGVLVPVEWLEVGNVQMDGKALVAARYRGDEITLLITPEGWTPERSLCGSAHRVEESKVPERLRFLRHENGVDVFIDVDTGKLKHIGRTGLEPDCHHG